MGQNFSYQVYLEKLIGLAAEVLLGFAVFQMEGFLDILPSLRYHVLLPPEELLVVSLAFYVACDGLYSYRLCVENVYLAIDLCHYPNGYLRLN